MQIDIHALSCELDLPKHTSSGIDSTAVGNPWPILSSQPVSKVP